MVNISFDNYDLQNSEIISETIDKDSATEREINLIDYPKADGAFYVDSRLKPKIISVTFSALKDTWSEVDDKIDTIKEKLYGVETAVLEIDHGTEEEQTQQYTALASNLTLTEDRGQAIGLAKYSVDFIIPSGYGKNPSTESFGTTGITTAIHTDSVTIEGAKKPYPILTLDIATAGNVNAIEIKNNTTNTEMRVAPAGGFTDGDQLVVDSNPENLSVQFNESDIDFSGMVLEWALGVNNYQITFEGDFVFEDQSQEETAVTDQWSVYGTNFMAQSFSPSINADCPKVKLMVKKVGTPFDIDIDASGVDDAEASVGGGSVLIKQAQSFTVGGSDIKFRGAQLYMRRGAGTVNKNYNIRLASDDGGDPGSDSLWQTSKAPSFFNTSNAWHTILNDGDAVTLTAATKYWIIWSSSSTSSTAYTTRLDTTNPYAGGNRARTANGGVSWTQEAGQDFMLKVLIDGDLDVVLYDDDGGGDPDMGSAVANGATTISYDNIPTDWSELDAIFSTSPALLAANTYHIVCDRDDSDQYNYYLWKEAVGGTYPDGKANRSTDSGTTWSDVGLDDMIFTTYYELGVPGHTANFAGEYYKLYP